MISSKKRRFSRSKLTIAGLMLGTAIAMYAQITGSGAIQGVVSDSSGAVVPAATVEATNIETGVKTARQTTDAGFYLVSPLPAGQYKIVVSAPGFATLIQDHLAVDALGVVTFNATLQLGAASQTVTVTSAPPPLDTADASIGQTLRNEIYTALPLTMGTGGASINSPRDPTAFAALMPGVTGYGSNNTVGGVSGAGIFDTEVYVDGMPITTTVLQGEVRYLSFGVSVEAVDQFQLESAGSSVLYGGQGASNFVLKSGTNEFHGLAFGNLRNSVFDSRGFFPAVKPENRQTEFGGTLGGPIIKNKLFFFGSYGGYRTKFYTAPTLISLPTPRERAGDFTEFPASIFDPLSTNCPQGGACSRQPFPGNLIPTSRISPVSSFLESFLPNPTNSAIQNNYLGSLPVGFATNSYDAKIDDNLSDNHRLGLVFTTGARNMTTNYRNGNIPLPYTDSRTVSENMTTASARHTWIITSALLNQISLGFNRFWVPISDPTIASSCGFPQYCGKWMTSAGVSGLPPYGQASQSFPYMQFDGPNVPFSWRNGNSPAFNEGQNTVTLQDNVQWTRGQHGLTFGFQTQRLQANEAPQTYGTWASWDFSNTETAGFNPGGTLLTSTGNGYATYLLGAVNSTTLNDNYVVEVGARLRTYSWWVQDNYKISRRLALSLGLRQDFFTPWTEVKNRMSWLNPTLPNPAIGGYPGALQFAGNVPDSCGCPNYQLSTYLKNIEPRGGLAYSITAKAVVRIGYAINTTRMGADAGSGTKVGTGLLGYNAQPTFSSLDGGITPAFYWQNGLPAYQRGPFYNPSFNTGFYTGNPQGGSITYGDPTSGPHPPRFQNWNVTVDYALTQTLTVEGSYVGSNGHWINGGPQGIWTDQMNPRYLALGNLLLSPATSANVAAAQATIPGVSLPYSTFSGTISQMLRPFPQYSSISSVWGEYGNANFNSLQIVVRKTYSHGLSFNFNYTFAKGFDDLTAYSSYIDSKAQSVNPTHTINGLFVYRLPFGNGGSWSPQNSVAKAVVSNWELSGVTTFRSGTGLGAIMAACNVPNAGTCYANYNPNFSGPVLINGGYGSGNLTGSSTTAFLNSSAFVSPSAYTYGNTPRTLPDGLRGPLAYNQNVSLKRSFRITERIGMTFQADSLNAFNFVNFGLPSTNLTSSSFGKITSQANTPRIVQFGARITF